MPAIYNLRTIGYPNAIRVDRSSPWGNPFFMLSESERAAVCQKFRVYAVERARLEPNWLTPLQGKNLACWCAPKQCHAEILMELANGGVE